MALKNPPSHLNELIENVTEVKRLMDFHRGAAGSGPGRKYNVEILSKSAIVLTVACLEAYVEDLAKAALEHLIENAADHKVFPNNVLEIVASKHQGPNAWKLAGEGWKQMLRDNLKDVLARTTGALNTPKTGQVDELFLKTIGYTKISNKWGWPGSTAANTAKRLDALVTLRGSIAHRVKSSKSVTKKDVLNAIDLISRLAVKTNNEMHNHLNTLCGKAPWGRVRYKKTS
jgi:hypothetical protein